MEISERIRERPVMSAAFTLAFIAVIWGWRVWMAAPQIGPEQPVFETVDALFTALTSKDVRRLDDCDQRLQSYHDEGSLPSAAAKRLDAIIKQARAGQWEPSAHKLYDFMLAQRRIAAR